MSVCAVSECAAKHVLGWIQRRPHLQEESITDWFLDELDRNCSDITHHQHTKPQEAKNGADWDWWLMLPSGQFAFRIQAKRMRQNHNHAKDLLRSNQNGLQIDLLMQSSLQHNFFPLYALYGIPTDNDRCRLPFPRDVAVFMSPAHEVQGLTNTSTHIEDLDLQAISIPVQCMLCCWLNGGNPNTDPLDHFDRMFGSPVEYSPDSLSPEGTVGYQPEPPDVVYELFEAEPGSEQAQEALENYIEQFPGTNGIVITRFRLVRSRSTSQISLAIP